MPKILEPLTKLCGAIGFHQSASMMMLGAMPFPSCFIRCSPGYGNASTLDMLLISQLHDVFPHEPLDSKLCRI